MGMRFLSRAGTVLAPYLISLTAIVIVSWVLPLSGLGDSAGFLIFAVLIACAWFLGTGPAMLSPLMLIATFHVREHGFSGLWSFTGKQLFDLIIITGFTTAVGVAGTLRRRSLAVAEQRSRQLQEQDRRKDEFLATLAHELRNPLAPIRTGLEVMRLLGRSPSDVGKVQELRQMMQRQVDHLVRLIDDLLDVSRINTGKIEIRRQRVPLADVIRDGADSARPQIAAAGLELSVSLPAEPVLLDVDATRTSQVLMNLLNNAAKFTPAGGRIWLSASSDGLFVEIRVRDNGIGIAPEFLPQMFELFVQAADVRTRSQSGLGIGLSLARTLAEMHGGTLAATSEGLGKGSEFILRLPRPADLQGRPLARTETSGTPPRRRILIVDDNQDAARGLSMLLSSQGHVCELAFDASSALIIAPQFRPDTFLLDLGMPGMSGLDLAARLRKTPDFQQSLLVAVTGWGQPEDRAQCLAAGFDRHLVKPVGLEELNRVLTAAATE